MIAAMVGWPLVLVKELIDNALDACESAKNYIAPEITITLEPDAITVEDNGPGLRPEIIDSSLDYTVRVSDKKHYVSPTRGQLGNALKCVWAATFVATATGLVEVTACGLKHRITVKADQIAQTPEISHEHSVLVKNGTSVRVFWPEIASLEVDGENEDFYQNEDEEDEETSQTQTVEQALPKLIADLSAFNPHASFKLVCLDKTFEYPASDPAWSKWKASQPTSAHWHRNQDFAALIAAEIKEGNHKTIRDFIGDFDGLSGTQRRKEVLDVAKISDIHLSDLVLDGGVDPHKAGRLLKAMQETSRPVNPKRLGLLGKEHLTSVLIKKGVEPNSIKYSKSLGMDSDGLPFVIEAAFGRKEERRRDLVIGLNNSVVFKVPSDHLADTLSNACDVQPYDPVVLAVHIACPRLTFTDHGKGAIVINGSLAKALEKGLTKVTRDFIKIKRRAERNERGMSDRDIRHWHAQNKKDKQHRIKDAAYEVMPEAYRRASADGTLPANARQVMYQARPLILEKTEDEIWEKDSYFTQTLLPEYQDEHPVETASWDVVYDARGHFVEPHVRAKHGIGTLEVRSYVKSFDNGVEDVSTPLDDLYPTHGPKNRYKFALFLEKEGFDPLLARTKIAEQYDLAIFSSKGQSTTATRELVDKLSQAGVTILVAHDFDVSGFSIVYNLGHSNHRYHFDCDPNVIDLGLRLCDVQEMNLESEVFNWSSRREKDPGENLSNNGATDEEREFLVEEGSKHSKGYWSGRRVELNAMTSDQFIAWLERKFKDYGVEKVIPDTDVLADAWQRANQISRIQKAIDEINLEPEEVAVPKNLEKQIRKLQKQDATLSWDKALVQIAGQNNGARRVKMRVAFDEEKILKQVHGGDNEKICTDSDVGTECGGVRAKLHNQRLRGLSKIV
jgi:DNA topoisomerase VI subunit B